MHATYFYYIFTAIFYNCFHPPSRPYTTSFTFSFFLFLFFLFFCFYTGNACFILFFVFHYAWWDSPLYFPFTSFVWEKKLSVNIWVTRSKQSPLLPPSLENFIFRVVCPPQTLSPHPLCLKIYFSRSASTVDFPLYPLRSETYFTRIASEIVPLFSRKTRWRRCRQLLRRQR